MNENSPEGNKEAMLTFPMGRNVFSVWEVCPRSCIEKTVEQEFDIKE